MIIVKKYRTINQGLQKKKKEKKMFFQIKRKEIISRITGTKYNLIFEYSDEMVLTGGHFVLFQHELTKLRINTKSKCCFITEMSKLQPIHVRAKLKIMKQRQRVIESRVVLGLSN